MAKKDISKIKNVTKKRSESHNIQRRITTETQMYRVRQDIAKWRAAVRSAENIHNPQRYSLYQTYADVILDGHLSAAISQRKSLILSKRFQVVDKNGKEVEEKTALINKKWFRDYLELCLDSRFYGFSLIQFDSLIDDEFIGVDLVPRYYVKPELGIVTDNYASLVGTSYKEKPFKDWCLGVGMPNDLGLLMKAAPYVIWKKNAIGAWAEFCELFGVPFRKGMTNVRDEVTRSNMENMLKNMGVAAWGVFDTDDEVELLESGKTDAYQVFDMMIARCNSELSKLILTVTGTMEEKTHVGSAEVMERMLEKVSLADESFIEGVNNYQLIPFLNNHGLGFEGLSIKIEKQERFTLEQKGKFDVELIKTGKYKFTPQYLKENYGAEVIEVESKEEDPTLQEFKNRLGKYYS